MRMINISKKKFSDLEKLKLDDSIFNTEAQIFLFNYRGKEQLLKKLYRVNGNLFANKLYTIEMLDYYRKYLPSSFCIPNSLVSINGEIVGFTIDKIDGINLSLLLNDKDIWVKEKLFYLKKVGENLNQMKYIRKYTNLDTLFINDLHEANIMVNTDNKEIHFIDLDSSRILSDNCFASRYLCESDFLINKTNKYIYNFDDNKGDGIIIANENSDLFCYNVMVLNYLFGSNIVRMNEEKFFEYLNYLSYLKFDKKLLDIFYKITLSCDNNNPCDYLDLLSDNQVYRANEKVYKKVIGK